MAIYDKKNKKLCIPSIGLKCNIYRKKMEEAYQSGYTAGYNKGLDDAYDECGKDFSREYFTIKLTENTDVPFYGNQAGPFYRINGGEWFTNEASGSNPTVIALKIGDRIEMKHTRHIQISFLDFPCEIYGNVLSLLYGDDFLQHTDVPGGESSDAMTLFGLFAGSTGIVDASRLAMPTGEIGESGCESMFQECTGLVKPPKLPAATVGESGYFEMFAGCTSLVNAPTLPATTLGKTCYYSMFDGCTSLRYGPSVLPASALTRGAYGQMFNDCTSLVSAPELPAETLAEVCYVEMFAGCSSLSSVKCLATDISARGCTSGWLDGVSPTGTFIKSLWMSDWTTGEDGVPEGWTVVDV